MTFYCFLSSNMLFSELNWVLIINHSWNIYSKKIVWNLVNYCAKFLMFYDQCNCDVKLHSTWTAKVRISNIILFGNFWPSAYKILTMIRSNIKHVYYFAFWATWTVNNCAKKLRIHIDNFFLMRKLILKRKLLMDVNGCLQNAKKNWDSRKSSVNEWLQQLLQFILLIWPLSYF